MGWLAVDRYTNPYLVCISSQKSSASLRQRLACGQLLPDDLAGTMGLLFHVDFRARTAKFARGVEIAHSRVVDFHRVDFSDFARVGHATLV